MTRPATPSIATINALLAADDCPITITSITDIGTDEEMWGPEDGDPDTLLIGGMCTEDGEPEPIPFQLSWKDGAIQDIATF